MRPTLRPFVIALAAAAVLPFGAGVAIADTTVTIVTGTFDHGDVAGSANVTVRAPAETVGVQTGAFATDDAAGSSHVTLRAPATAAPRPVSTPAATPEVTVDPATLAGLIRASHLDPAVPAAVRAGLVR